jgi:hypothetical protein
MAMQAATGTLFVPPLRSLSAARPLRRAAETLGVKARRTGGLAKGGKWEWTLLD